jgi:3-oxoacyl-[acyl-carrier protein] reductase
MAGRLEGRKAVITGGTRGIGLAIARAFQAEGASLLLTGTSEATIGRARPIVAAEGCHWLALDLVEAGAEERLIEAAMDALGGIDVLVNNAAVIDQPGIWDTTAEAFDRVLAVNLRAVFLCARAAALRMRDAGGGSIVNLGSVAGQIGGVATGPAYVAAKAGIEGLTRSLARHLAPHGIRVNCIAPADIETDMTAAWPEALRARLISMTPLGRFARPEEVTGAAVFLACDESSFVTGQTINVNGGVYMG